MGFSFFIIGAGRSGTSLLASLVDAHPHLHCGMEVASVHCLSGERVTPSTSIDARLACLARECHRHSFRVSGICGNKITTEQLAFLDEIAPAESAFFSHFTTQKIIYVLRDGRRCVASKMDRKGKTLEAAIASWRRGLRVLDWLRNNAADRTMEVRFETLLKHPEDVLKDVAEFLEQTYDPQMLSGTNNPIMPEIYRGMDGFQHSKAEQPLSEYWHALIEDDLREYGYL